MLACGWAPRLTLPAAASLARTILGAAAERSRLPWALAVAGADRGHILMAELYRRLRGDALLGLPLGADYV
eukprot:4440173-Alexandrium_andersonii.AAC.1